MSIAITQISQEPGNGSRLVYMRDLLRELVIRDMKILYKRSFLGIVWSLLNPLMQLVVFCFIFQRVFQLKVPHYPAFVFCGMLVWNWYSMSLFQAATAITGNRELIRKPGFSSPILPVVTVTTQLVHFLLALPILVIFLVVGGIHFSASLVLIPVLLVLQYVWTLGLGYYMAAINVLFRDTQHLLGVFLLLQFYLTPVFYSLKSIPAEYKTLYTMNPMVSMVEAYRAILLSGSWPPAAPLWILGLTSIVLLVTGHQTFLRTSYRFAEEM